MIRESKTGRADRRGDLRRRADALVLRLRKEVLPTPGRRALVRAALGHAPGEPRTFHAIKEIADFLPENADEATEHAFLTVAAALCAQPPQGRQQDIAAARTVKPSAPPDHDGDLLPDTTTPDIEDIPAPTATTEHPDNPASDEPTEKDPWKVHSLGASCAVAVNTGVAKKSTMEWRLHALCRLNAAGVHRQLPPLISHLRSGKVPIDWARLIEDLTLWENFHYRIAARWVREYYRALNNEASTTENTTSIKENA